MLAGMWKVKSVEFMTTSICLVLTAGWIVILFIELWKIGNR